MIVFTSGVTGGGIFDVAKLQFGTLNVDNICLLSTKNKVGIQNSAEVINGRKRSQDRGRLSVLVSLFTNFINQEL